MGRKRRGCIGSGAHQGKGGVLEKVLAFFGDGGEVERISGAGHGHVEEPGFFGVVFFQGCVFHCVLVQRGPADLVLFVVVRKAQA